MRKWLEFFPKWLELGAFRNWDLHFLRKSDIMYMLVGEFHGRVTQGGLPITLFLKEKEEQS
jgi:hypothetical protein